MKKFLLNVLFLMSVAFFAFADDYQLPDPQFEDWSGPTFDGQIQPKYWHASNLEQSALGMTFRFNFANRETGRTGYCLMVQDREVGAAGIVEISPGYFSLGTAWQYLEGINTGSATAGTYGGYSFTHRPDSVSVWIKRMGGHTAEEDFHILYYAWSGTAQGSTYKNKGGGCTSTNRTDEESDIRIALDGNECTTNTVGGQVAEGWWRERKTYGSWTNIRVPIYYMNDNEPKKCNLLFSASNYPNFRACDGMYAGNSLYVDDIELIYSSKIDKLEVADKQWKGFDPNSTEVQVYSLGETATEVPDIVAYRGCGSLTNTRGKTANFPGRKLSGSEITIVKGDLENTPTTITVRAEDGSSTTVYKIQFQRAASTNAKLAGISVNGTPIANFSATKYNYNVELPYGTTDAPVVTAEKQEDKQTISITDATSTTGTATVAVTAADGKTKATYTLTFSVGKLSDNTLQSILVNGNPVPGFTPSQASYKVSLPVGTSTLPVIEAVSAYPDGAQTVNITMPTLANLDGGQALIKVTTPGNSNAKTYKLTFKLEASSYSFLNAIKLDGVALSNFEPTNLTYYIGLPLGTTALPEITWDLGDEFQTVAKAEGGIDGTTRITVTAGNGDQTIYKLVFSTEKSEISVLNGITIGGVALDGFDPDVTNYSYKLEIGTTELPEIVAVPHDEYQNIIITKGNVNGTTRITVTAGNGNTTIYLIAFSVDAYTDNTLKSIKVGGVELDGFDQETNEYYYTLPQGTTELPEVTVEKQDEKLQTVTVRSGGVGGDYRITVRPQSGASRTYIIHFSVTTSSNVKLADLKVAGYTIDFDPEVLEYHVTLAEGVSEIPAVTFVKAEEKQRVLSVLEDTVQSITVTAESGAKRTYTINFRIQLSANAFLNMIYLDGDTLHGFEPTTLHYDTILLGTKCPTITVDKAAGQQVTITAPIGAGTAKILVSPEVGAANTYSITFSEVLATSVQLANILIDGIAITGFDPTVDHYEATFTKAHPVVTGEPADPSQTIQTMWAADTCWLHVSDAEGNSASYFVAFTRTLINNTNLASIKADGVQIAGFAPTTKDYNFEWTSGVAYPELSYVKGDESQIVTFGQVSDGKWNFHVVAENGDATDYTVQYSVIKNSDATLENIELVTLPDGQHLDFVATQNNYGPFNLDEGVELPDVQVTAKAGQRVMSYNAGENEQRVVVTAESGATNTYIITYVRKKNDNALLKAILVGGKKLAGFDPEDHDYTVELPMGTTEVPNVFPIGQLDNQTITTYLCSVNGTTRIHVLAQDSLTEAEYTIAFPVKKSNNAKLGSLTIDGKSHSVDTTTYTFDVPFGTFEPYIVSYTKAEDGQFIHYEEAPITGVTKITVTSESGEATRTYSISYNVAVPEGANVIKKINYSYVDKNSNTVTGSINNPAVGQNKVIVPFGTKSFEVTSYEKNYDEQAVLFYNGGIRRGAKLVAIANREEEGDVEYNVIPEMEADTVGKLKDLKFKGVTIKNFNPDVYNYIVNVTEEPTADNFVGTPYESGKTVSQSTIDSKKKQITLTVANGEKYSVCWFYENDKDPFDFRATWVEATQKTGFKPSSDWHVIADYTDGYLFSLAGYKIPYVSGKEAIQYGSNGVMLSTLRQGALRQSIPGMMSISAMSVAIDKNGGSKTSISQTASDGIEFRNTPELLTFQYNALQANSINAWSIKLYMGDGSTQQTSTFSGNYSTKNTPTNASLTINYPSSVTNKINAVLNSCGTENAKDMNGYSSNEYADLVLQNMHLTYNSTLTGAKINGKNLTPSNNVFTYNLGTSEVITGIPSLKFTGAVHDQMQTIEWLNNGEWVNGELKAKVVNYGENAYDELRDSTVYTVVFHRDPVTSLDYTATFGGYPTTEKGDTTFINMPYGTKALPDFTIEPESPHQLFEIAKNGKNVTVTVKAENGTSKKTIYIFREEKSNDAELESFTCDGIQTVDPTNNIFSVTATKMPEIEYETKSTVLQFVDLNYTANGATLTVTAEDGKTKKTYTVNRINPTVATTGIIEQFELNGTPMSELGGATNTSCVKARMTAQDTLLYARKFAQDSVIFVQTPAKMEWRVFDSNNTEHTYTWTYPTTPSDNALLRSIRINGVDYSEFVNTREDYTSDPIYAADSIYIQPVAAEAVQTIEVTPTYENNGVTYAIAVTSESESVTKTYKLRVDQPKSEDKTLAGIYLDGALIANFNPATTAYTVTLPTPAVKTAEQVMPSITYVAGHPGQTIVMENGKIGVDDPTWITVTNEKDDAAQQYSVTVLAEPSHCADLTGIMINGKALEGFEPGRHYYSVEVSTNDIDVTYATNDRFQTVEVLKNAYNHNRTVRVTAQDGTTTSDYYITIFVQSQSSDATLNNILLEVTDSITHMVEIVDFLRTLNPDAKRFDPGLNNYDINLAPGTTVAPVVSAQLKMEGQSVEIKKDKMQVSIEVTAADGATKNTYHLNFLVPKSKNADLSMLYLDGDSLKGFDPSYYYYEVNLPVGVHSLPEVAAQKGEANQTLSEVVVDPVKLQASIKVYAEDSEVRPNTYLVVFHYTQSDADSLMMVYADGDTLRQFNPKNLYYNISLPVGSVFPDLSWAEADKWQTIKMDTVAYDANYLKRRIVVKSESGKSNTYIFDYTIEKSNADTLQMIYMNARPLEGFAPTKEEYFVTLSAAYANELNGALPTIEYLAADTLQTIIISQAPDTLNSKSLGYKTIISVTAPSGAMRFYTIHYSVETSNDASLNMIMLSGKPMSGFDSQKQIYRLHIDSRASLPAVTVVKKENAQTYEISIHGDSILIDVLAEDAITRMTYMLIFNRQLSDETKLQSIRLEGHPEFLYNFVSTEYDYFVKLKYGEDTIPAISCVKSDSLQFVPDTFTIDTLESGDLKVTIPVIAPNGEDETEYTITFRFTKNNDAFLTGISLGTQPLANFSRLVTDYVYVHPFGSDTTDFFTADSITYVLSDSLANATLVINAEGVIMITIVAQDEETEQTYTIRQIIGKDADCALEAILLDNVLLKGFDPEITFYTYLLKDGDVPPSITAIPRSQYAEEPSVGTAAAGDTCRIICTAADGTERRYYIHFAVTTVNSGLEPTGDDVIIKRIPYTNSFFAASLRQGVQFALYDQYGHLVFLAEQMPTANPNDIEVASDPNRPKAERLADIVVSEENGVIIPVNPGELYLYGFYSKVGTKLQLLKSGKLVALP